MRHKEEAAAHPKGSRALAHNPSLIAAQKLRPSYSPGRNTWPRDEWRRSRRARCSGPWWPYSCRDAGTANVHFASKSKNGSPARPARKSVSNQLRIPSISFKYDSCRYSLMRFEPICYLWSDKLYWESRVSWRLLFALVDLEVMVTRSVLIIILLLFPGGSAFAAGWKQDSHAPLPPRQVSLNR